MDNNFITFDKQWAEIFPAFLSRISEDTANIETSSSSETRSRINTL